MRTHSLFIIASSVLIASALGAPQNDKILIKGLNAVEVPPVEIPKDRPTNPPPPPPMPIATEWPTDDDLNLIAYCIDNPQEDSCKAFLRMSHYFLTGRLNSDPILRSYLDSMHNGPVTAVLTATSVHSQFDTVFGTRTYFQDQIEHEMSTETSYHGASGTGTGHVEPTQGFGDGQDGKPPSNILNQAPSQPTQLIPITETIIQTLVGTITETETVLFTYTAPPEQIYATETVTLNAPPELVYTTETITEKVPPELVYLTQTITQNDPPELVYITETVVQDAMSIYTVPPELIYLTKTITQDAPPPQIIFATETITENDVSVYTAPPELVYVTETTTQFATPPPPTYECQDLISQPSVQQCLINNGFVHFDFPKDDCNQLQAIVNHYSDSFKTCYNGFPFNNTTCSNEPTTVTEHLAASTSTIHVAEETKYVNVGTCGTCDSDKPSDSNTNNNNNNIVNNIYNSFISGNGGAGYGYYFQGSTEYPSYGDYAYGGYINYKGVKAWSTPYGIYFANGTRISFHADCSYDMTTHIGLSGAAGKGNSTSGQNNNSNTNLAVIPAEVATSTDYYETPCTDEVPYVDPEQCSVTAVTHPQDCTETDMHQHTEDC